jgi:hypothetical protein
MALVLSCAAVAGPALAEGQEAVAALLGRMAATHEALASAEAQHTPERWAAADHSLRELVAVMKTMVAERSRQEAALRTNAILTDRPRIASALKGYAVRKELEAQGHIVILPGTGQDADLLFNIRDILTQQGGHELLDVIQSTGGLELRAAFENLLSGAEPRQGVAIDSPLRAFLLECDGVRRENAEVRDRAIEMFCSQVGDWRRELDAGRAPGLLEASLLACEARIAQNREDAAAEEYGAHAQTLYGALEAGAASERLLETAQSLYLGRRTLLARRVFLLVRGRPAEEETAYLARLKAAWCLLDTGERAVAAAEMRDIFRKGFSDERVAPVLFDLANACPAEHSEFVLDVIRTVLGDLPEDLKPRATACAMTCLLQLGKLQDALAQFAVLKETYPEEASTEYAERTLREAGLLPERQKPD